jgi:hypothetical protein
MRRGLGELRLAKYSSVKLKGEKWAHKFLCWLVPSSNPPAAHPKPHIPTWRDSGVERGRRGLTRTSWRGGEMGEVRGQAEGLESGYQTEVPFQMLLLRRVLVFWSQKKKLKARAKKTTASPQSTLSLNSPQLSTLTKEPKPQPKFRDNTDQTSSKALSFLTN